MTKEQSLDKQAAAAASQYMGEVAWPTVAFALIVFSGYLATLAGALVGWLPLWAAVPLSGLFTYLSYTVAHEAAHGSIIGSRQSMRWLNEALGYGAAWILMIPLTAHRHEHLSHHRNTNDPHNDPDYGVADFTRSPARGVMAIIQIFKAQFTHYARHRWHKAPLRQNVQLCLELAAALTPRIALVFMGYGMEVLAVMGLGWLLGVTVTLYLFAYVVHHPHQDTGRYVDTSVIVATPAVNRLLTWAWVYQNYHAIHHLFPRVPFYRYAAVFGEIEPIMVEKGAPIYRLGPQGLTRQSLSTPATAGQAVG